MDSRGRSRKAVWEIWSLHAQSCFHSHHFPEKASCRQYVFIHVSTAGTQLPTRDTQGCGASTHTCSAPLFSLEHRGDLCRAAAPGPAAALGPWRAGQLWCISSGTVRKGLSCTAAPVEHAHLLKSVLLKSTITSLFSGFVSAAAESDLSILTLHFRDVKQN